jgi:acyl-CoA hydrolase
MKANLIVAEMDPSRVDVACRAVTHELIPNFRTQPGADRGYWMVNRRTGEVLVLTTWDDEEALDAARAADGAHRGVAERTGLAIRGIQTMDVLDANDAGLTSTPATRWARATWVEGAPPAEHPETARGFCGSYRLGDPVNGAGLVLSFWDGPDRALRHEVGPRVNRVGEFECIGVAAPDRRGAARATKTTTVARSARRISAEAAAALVRSGDWVDYGAVLAKPDAFDKALAARVHELEHVGIRGCLSTRPLAVVEADPGREHVSFFSWHLGGYDRKQSDAGLQSYIPCNLGEIPDYYRRFLDPPDVMVIKTCPVDGRGYFNFSAANLWHGAVAERAKVVIVEVDPALPYVHGIGNGLHESEVDYVIEGEGQALPELPNPAPTTADRAVARLIAEEIDDGACLQIGIGAMPNAVCSLLMDSGVRNLGVHTEMLTDGIIDLYRAGVVTGAAKTMHPGKIVCSFGFGSRTTYDAIDDNPDVSCLPVEMTNLPDVIIHNDRLTAINNTTQMDLQGQAASESSGHRHISGTGGQLQFIRGAYASKGGKSFLCMSSTYERNGVRRSRVVLNLTPGNIVTAPRSDVMYVVTEFGLVNLKGKSVPERAKAMISLAHPDFRDDLEREARTNGLLPRSFAC